MNTEINDLGKWTWYTARFLNFCNNGSSDAQKTVEQFLKEEGFTRTDSFHTWNHSSVLVSLYGLFVIPKEFWRNMLGDDNNEKVLADNIIFEDFNFESRSQFHGDTKDMDKCVFLRRFRNSLAHANFKINKHDNVLEFVNYDTTTGQVNFHVHSTLQGLSDFLAEIGKFFINEVQ